MKEIVYQAVPYVGLAKVFDFLHATNDVLTERGVELPLPAQSASTPQTRAEVGLAVQNRIVGEDKVAGMYATAAADERALPALPVRQLLRRLRRALRHRPRRPVNC